MKCGNCVKKIKANFSKNVHEMDIAVNLEQKYVVITHTRDFDPQTAMNILSEMSYQVQIINKDKLQTLVFSVDGMQCNNCVKKITENMMKLEDVSRVEVSLENKTVKLYTIGNLDYTIPQKVL